MTNTDNPRDTQFKGFAKLLMRDLDAVSTTTYASLDKAKEAYELAIARRAHDLVENTIYSMSPIAFQCCENFDQLVREIPDMTEWPDEA
jgi:hypothetical protein